MGSVALSWLKILQLDYLLEELKKDEMNIDEEEREEFADISSSLLERAQSLVCDCLQSLSSTDTSLESETEQASALSNEQLRLIARYFFFFFFFPPIFCLFA